MQTPGAEHSTLLSLALALIRAQTLFTPIEICNFFGLVFPAKLCGPIIILPPCHVQFGWRYRNVSFLMVFM